MMKTKSGLGVGTTETAIGCSLSDPNTKSLAQQQAPLKGLSGGLLAPLAASTLWRAAARLQGISSNVARRRRNRGAEAHVRRRKRVGLRRLSTSGKCRKDEYREHPADDHGRNRTADAWSLSW